MWFTEKQPGEEFWSVAPGCGVISEGMVWVTVIPKSTKGSLMGGRDLFSLLFLECHGRRSGGRTPFLQQTGK